jgi:hypothetical protein
MDPYYAPMMVAALVFATAKPRTRPTEASPPRNLKPSATTPTAAATRRRSVCADAVWPPAAERHETACD